MQAARTPECERLLTLAEAKRKFRLQPMHIYAACRRGDVQAFEYERVASKLYPESQLRRLAAEIGLYSDRAA